LEDIKKDREKKGGSMSNEENNKNKMFGKNKSYVR
jgi:hypothetical protein